jgi:predicted ester cyclase
MADFDPNAVRTKREKLLLRLLFRATETMNATMADRIRARGFPDHDAKVEHMIAEGDLVATHKTFTGTHTGEFFGTAPTGRRATIRVMDIVRYRDGKVAEHWNIVDFAGLMRQLQG